MTKEEQATNLIDKYMDLLRIDAAKNKEIEVKNQIRQARAKLQALGIIVDDLIIETE